MTLMKGAGHALGTGNSIIKGPAVGENLAWLRKQKPVHADRGNVF